MSFIQENIVNIWLLLTLQILIPIAILIVWSFGFFLKYLFQKTTEPVQKEDAEVDLVPS